MSPHVFIHLTKDHGQKKATTNAFRSGQHSRQTDTHRAVHVRSTRTLYIVRTEAPKCPSRNSFVRLDDRKKSTSYEFLFFFSFFPSPAVFFFSFSFRKIVSTLALDVRTRRKYSCEYAGDRGTILINQINEKTIILI